MTSSTSKQYCQGSDAIKNCVSQTTAGWETIIGLEIHAQLNTASKLFSSDANNFGNAPNTNISELCLALPGSLPVINKEAVHKAIRFGLAINGQIQQISRFDRKSYFYPDCSRSYQITQLEFPIIKGGHVSICVQGVEKEVQINRVQLEDDAGMLKHFSSFAGVDFNRAGVPLLEIVSEPCLRSAKEASAYAMAIRSLLDYLDISNCNMEEGSLRFDVNISVRRFNENELRNRIEIKNMNSFSNLESAIEHEVQRQIALYETHPDMPFFDVISQATYRWDPDRAQTILMRSKEHAEDYRYFPDPDLLPLFIEEKVIQELAKTIPELPVAKEKRYKNELELSELQSYFLTSDKHIAYYFEEACKSCIHAKQLANWIIVEFTGRLKEKGKTIYQSSISPQSVAQLVNMILSQEITGKIAKLVADEMVAFPEKLPHDIVSSNPSYKPVRDITLLTVLAEKVIEDHAETVKEILAGRDRKFAFLVGQVMKQTKGSASPDTVNKVLKEAIHKYYGVSL